MASAQKPLKGILKKPKSAPPSPAPQPPSPAADLDFQRIALQHARILQQHKDLEARVFEAINTLLDYPLHPSEPSAAVDPSSSSSTYPGTTPSPSSPTSVTTATATATAAAHPSPTDAAAFKQLVRIFQPTDYDDLIEERTIANRCGYALCPNARRRLPGAGEFKLRNVGRKDFDIVRTRDLEKWCSDDCARRALYVKVQLGETPAWERDGDPRFQIELLGEGRQEGQPEAEARDGLAERVENMKLDSTRRKETDAASLAVERGEKQVRLPVPGLSFDIAIREKPSSGTATAPTPDPPRREVRPEDVHRVVEGHIVRHGRTENIDMDDD
jgi:hypothetical protein